MSDIAIALRGVTKIFRLYPDLVRARLKQRLFFWKRYFTEKTVLRDIDLEVKRGQVVGVIGPNGAGKTTLLKLIAGISYPSSGVVDVRGRVVAVLALGLGFHPRLSGIENIQLAGMMLGMSRSEVRQRSDWIVNFSELDQYISQPLSAYSSGMRARLSFAVAACWEPEILIIDEALATGDVRFVQKCINRIHDITRSGTTALFVSHSIWSIKRLTNRCILIDGGRIADDGETGRVTDRYYEVMLRHEVHESYKPGDLSEFVGTGEVVLRSVQLQDASGKRVDVVESGENASFVLELEAKRELPDVTISMSCGRDDGVAATTLGSAAGGALNDRHRFEYSRLCLAAGMTKVRISCTPLLLAPGDYSLDIAMFDFGAHSGYTSNQQYYFKARVIEFGVRRLGNPNRSIVYYQPARIFIDGAADAQA